MGIKLGISFFTGTVLLNAIGWTPSLGVVIMVIGYHLVEDHLPDLPNPRPMLLSTLAQLKSILS